LEAPCCTSLKTKQALLESVCKGQRQQLAWTCLQPAFPLRKKIVDDKRPRPSQIIVQLEHERFEVPQTSVGFSIGAFDSRSMKANKHPYLLKWRHIQGKTTG
jgi:hypothetical protein